MAISLLLICAVLIATIFYFLYPRRTKNFPPGPSGFPLLGHVPMLGLEPHKVVAKWTEKYGNILGLQFGSFRVVMISDFKIGKDIMHDATFAYRPKVRIASERSKNSVPTGVVFSNGRTWREQRAFAQRRLRFGTTQLESILTDLLKSLLKDLYAQAGSPISTAHRFNIEFVTPVWPLMFSEPFPADNKAIMDFCSLNLRNMVENNVMATLSMFMPWLINVLPQKLSGYDVTLSLFNGAGPLFEPYIAKHRESHTPGKPRDFVDMYIDEIDGTTDPGSSFHGSRGSTSLMVTVADMFVGALDTAPTTFEWVLLMLATYPKVQERAAAEIRAAIGKDRLPTFADRKSVPYTEAIIQETMRYRTLAPFGVFHSTTEDVHFHGYDLPKDTMVYVNAHAVHNNKEWWGDPENFRPERWLNDDQSEYVRREGLMTFGVGKRYCLGEQLTREELYLFTVGFLQHFKLEPDPDHKGEWTTDQRLGGSMALPPFHKIAFKPRV